MFCSDINGDQIDKFGGKRTQLSGRKINCECALTRDNLSVGSVKPTCCENGNFEGRQCISGLCFCVDQFGRQIGMEVDQVGNFFIFICYSYPVFHNFFAVLPESFTCRTPDLPKITPETPRFSLRPIRVACYWM